jgi:hypothetical protein
LDRIFGIPPVLFLENVTDALGIADDDDGKPKDMETGDPSKPGSQGR